METSAQSRALVSASPRRLWLWAALIAVAGVLLRVVWFIDHEDSLTLALGTVFSPHLWSLPVELRGVSPGIGAFDPQLAAKAFAPGYGLMLRTLHEFAADSHALRVAMLAVQCALLFLTTLLTFALARRVIFGVPALLAPLLLTASVALLALPGSIAPWIPVMFLLVLGVWLLTLLREHLMRDRRGTREVLLTVLGGIVLGGAILFNPAVLVLAVPICWWAFRGIGREHATLLLVAVILLPACWLAVVQSELAGGIPADQAAAWFYADTDNVPASASGALDHAYAVATPWNPRFARGGWSSMNWNYEWILPLSVRAETTYISATRVLAGVLMVGYLLFVLAGLISLFAEGPGATARLIALPAIVMPLVTFISSAGNLLRLPALPFLMIALLLGALWAWDRLRAGRAGRSVQEPATLE